MKNCNEKLTKFVSKNQNLNFTNNSHNKIINALGLKLATNK